MDRKFELKMNIIMKKTFSNKYNIFFEYFIVEEFDLVTRFSYGFHDPDRSLYVYK